jgi:hypothetical protein
MFTTAMVVKDTTIVNNQTSVSQTALINSSLSTEISNDTPYH